MGSGGSQPTIVVYGATGFTGGLVCETLSARRRDFMAAGRRFDKLQRLSKRLGDVYDTMPTLREGHVHDPHSLDQMLEGAEVLINCAGPFTDIGPPVVEAAVRNDVHYLDTTGEQGFIRWVRDAWGEQAAERDVTLMPACAFEYATGVLAGRAALDSGVRTVGVSYGVRGMRPSAGTQKSIFRSLSDTGGAWVDGDWVERTPGSHVYEIPDDRGEQQYGVWFPGGEALFLPDLGEVDRVESCLTVGATVARLLSASSDYLPVLAQWLQPIADEVISWWRTYNDPGGHAPFEVLAFDLERSRRLAAVRGTDPYETTADIIVETATRLLDASSELEPGFQSVGRLFDPDDFARSVDVELERYASP